MDERCRFVLAVLAPEANISALCREFGVSRKTGYKWIHRFQEGGLARLSDRSRRPHSNPFEVSAEMVAEIVRWRLYHHTWGPKKLRAVLLRRYTAREVPAVSTIARILRRCSLIKPRKRRRRHKDLLWQRIEPQAPNDLWTVDFKGWWHTQDSRRCEPLTVRDEYSRLVLDIRAMTSTATKAVQEAFAQIFERYGLPKAIRTDNGPPFALAHSLRGLTRLSAWWVALGIRLERIELGHPEQNGGHERLHKDIRQELQVVQAEDLNHQQEIFDLWRMEFNCERPHEALGMRTPAQVHRPSPQRFTSEKPEIVYPSAFEVRVVRHHGEIKFGGQLRFISEALAGWKVGIERTPDEKLRIWFADLCLGVTDRYFRFAIRPEREEELNARVVTINVLPMS